MVAGTPPVLPPGYMSLFQAIDCVDPGALQKGTDQARKDADRFLDRLDLVAVNRQGPPDVPQPVYDEICRRRRRGNAFERVRNLCAWGTVPSELLPDDFSRSRHIPLANWLDERLSADLSSTGRTTIGDRPTRVSGWVMIETAALRAAIATDPEDSGLPHDGPKPASQKQIKNVLTTIYDDAANWGMWPPNVKAVRDHVVKRLALCGRSASISLIGRIAAEPEYERRRKRQGDRRGDTPVFLDRSAPNAS